MSVLVWVDHELDSLDDTFDLLAFTNSVKDLVHDLINYVLTTGSNSHHDIYETVLNLLIIYVDILLMRLYDYLCNLLDEDHLRILLWHRLWYLFNLLEFLLSLSEHMFLFPPDSFSFSCFLRRHLLLSVVNFVAAAGLAPSLTLLGPELSVPDVSPSATDLNYNICSLSLCLYNFAGSSLTYCGCFNRLNNLNTVMADHVTLHGLELPEANMAALTSLLGANCSSLLASLHISLSGYCNGGSFNLRLYWCIENFPVAELHSFWVRNCSVCNFSGASCCAFRFAGSTSLEGSLVAYEIRVFIENFIEDCVYHFLSRFYMRGRCLSFLFLTWIVPLHVSVDPVLADHATLN